MKMRGIAAILSVLAAAVPGRAVADWTLGNNDQGGITTVYITRSTTYGGAIGFVCDNTTAAMPEYILVVTSPFDAALGRLDVTMEIGARPPTISTWTASPRDNRLRSRDIALRDVLSALATEPGIAFATVDDFGRSYRVEAPIENLLELVPAFLAACDARPPAPLRRF